MTLWDSLAQFKKRGSFDPPYPANVRRFWAPDDDVHGAIMAVVKSAQLSLSAAMYGWDDEEIDALFRQAWQQEGLPVKVCLDKSQAGGVHEREILKAWPQDQIGNTLVIGQSRLHAISHLKTILIDGVVTIQGSTNLSASGERRQNNECTIVHDATFGAETNAKIELTYSEMLMQMLHRRLGRYLAPDSTKREG